jgi:hypothetical protein
VSIARLCIGAGFHGLTGTMVVCGICRSRLSLCLLFVQFATEAAITILRIDDLIKLEAPPEGAEE